MKINIINKYNNYKKELQHKKKLYNHCRNKYKQLKINKYKLKQICNNNTKIFTIWHSQQYNN